MKRLEADYDFLSCCYLTWIAPLEDDFQGNTFYVLRKMKRFIWIVALWGIAFASDAKEFTVERILAGDLVCVRPQSGKMLPATLSSSFLWERAKDLQDVDSCLKHGDISRHAELCVVAAECFSPSKKIKIFSQLEKKHSSEFLEKNEFSENEAVILYYIFKYLKVYGELNPDLIDQKTFHLLMTKLGNLKNSVTEEVVVSGLPPEVLASVPEQLEDIRKNGSLGARIYLSRLVRSMPSPIFGEADKQEEAKCLDMAKSGSCPYAQMLIGEISLAVGEFSLAQDAFKKARELGIREASLSLMTTILSRLKESGEPLSDATIEELSNLAYEALRERPIGLWTFEWAIMLNSQKKEYEEVVRLSYFIEAMKRKYVCAGSPQIFELFRSIGLTKSAVEAAKKNISAKRLREIKSETESMYEAGFYESPIYEKGAQIRLRKRFVNECV